MNGELMGTINYIYGLAGLGLLLIGWIYETILVLRGTKKPLPLGFAALYGFGTLLLAIHSWILNDLVFIILNVVLMLISIINILLGFKSNFKSKNKKSRNR